MTRKNLNYSRLRALANGRNAFENARWIHSHHLKTTFLAVFSGNIVIAALPRRRSRRRHLRCPRVQLKQSVFLFFFPLLMQTMTRQKKLLWHFHELYFSLPLSLIVPSLIVETGSKRQRTEYHAEKKKVENNILWKWRSNIATTTTSEKNNKHNYKNRNTDRLLLMMMTTTPTAWWSIRSCGRYYCRISDKRRFTFLSNTRIT